MDERGVFGLPGAAGDFNVKTFLTKPEVILRITGWVSHISQWHVTRPLWCGIMFVAHRNYRNTV